MKYTDSPEGIGGENSTMIETSNTQRVLVFGKEVEEALKVKNRLLSTVSGLTLARVL